MGCVCFDEISGNVMGLQNPSHCFCYSWQGKHGLACQPGQSMRNLLRINDLEGKNVKNRYMALGLGVLLAFSLTSCAGRQAQEPQEPKQEIQQAAPAVTEPTGGPVEVKQEVKATGTQSAPAEEEQDTGNEVDPAETAGETEPVVELFTEVNETVYATGTVNIRSSWSAESEKLGSLNKGDSVVRTGISIEGAEAEGWSRIQLSDGSTVYVSNKYLSTTKPVVQQPSGGTTETKPTDMQVTAEKKQAMAAQGYTTEFGTPTEEELEEAWSNIKVGP